MNERDILKKIKKKVLSYDIENNRIGMVYSFITEQMELCDLLDESDNEGDLFNLFTDLELELIQKEEKDDVYDRAMIRKYFGKIISYIDKVLKNEDKDDNKK